MLRQNIVNMYAHGNKVDLMVAEKDVVLTYVLKLFEAEGFHDLVFKGGTCLRKCYFGRITRFSEDLDFQVEKPQKIKDYILQMFNDREFHGIRFSFGIDDVYETADSFGVTLTYVHQWNPRSTVKIQVSFRTDLVFPPVLHQIHQESYSKYLEFTLPVVPSMVLEEIIAEKIRACYQRTTVRDAFDLYLFSQQPFHVDLLRKLVVLKMWSVHEQFNPKQLTEKISKGKFHWYDLERLIRKDIAIKQEDILGRISSRFSFLSALTNDEQALMDDTRKHMLHKEKRQMEDEVRSLYTQAGTGRTRKHGRTSDM